MTGPTMNCREFFCQALEEFVLFPSQHTASELSRACGAVWKIKATVPTNALNDIEAAIGNYVEVRSWERSGRTYAGAAQRIRPVLRQEYEIDPKAA